MAFTVEKENTGMIFKNDKQNDKQPDYKGQVNVAGKQLDVACWLKDGAKGRYMSVKFSEPYKKDEPVDENIGRETTKSHYTPSTYGEDDDVPFALLFAFIGLSFALAMCGQIIA